MKRLVVGLLLSLGLIFTGCLDIVEETNLNANGTGVYQTSFDIGGMIDMLELLSAADTTMKIDSKKFWERNIDSTIQMKQFTDTASNLSAEQKKFFHRATMRIRVEKENRKFVIGLSIPFDKPEDMALIAKSTEGGKGIGLIGKALGSTPLSQLNGSGDNMPSAGSMLSFHYREGVLERKIDEAKLAEVKKNQESKNFGEEKEMLENMKMSSIIRLPSPAKRVTGTHAKLSEDRKMVTITANFFELLTDPTILAYRIEY